MLVVAWNYSWEHLYVASPCGLGILTTCGQIWRTSDLREGNYHFYDQAMEVQGFFMPYSWLEQSSPPEFKEKVGNRFHCLMELLVPLLVLKKTCRARNDAVPIFGKCPQQFISLSHAKHTRSFPLWQQTWVAQRLWGSNHTVKLHLHKDQKSSDMIYSFRCVKS